MKKIEFYTVLVIAALLAVRIFAGMYMYVFLRILLVLVSIYYMWFGFFIFNEMGLKDLFNRSQRQKLSPLRVISSIIAGLIYSLSFITIVHTVEFYRGMHFLLGFSFAMNLGFTLFCFFILKYKKTEGAFMKQFLSRSLLFSLFFLFVMLVPVEKRLTTLYKGHPRFIEAYQAHRMDPDNEEKLQHLREERSAFR
ncbi:MAG: hypothetical protein ACK4VN_06270 [Bacteroidales bacterium]|mgnify:CR=1 FL=1